METSGLSSNSSRQQEIAWTDTAKDQKIETTSDTIATTTMKEEMKIQREIAQGTIISQHVKSHRNNNNNRTNSKRKNPLSLQKFHNVNS